MCLFMLCHLCYIFKRKTQLQRERETQLKACRAYICQALPFSNSHFFRFSCYSDPQTSTQTPVDRTSSWRLPQGCTLDLAGSWHNRAYISSISLVQSRTRLPRTGHERGGVVVLLQVVVLQRLPLSLSSMPLSRRINRLIFKKCREHLCGILHSSTRFLACQYCERWTHGG